jgi:hypothetical protein
MAALATVEDYVSAARVLLQDTIEEFRYSDVDLALGLNLAFIEAKRLRPDMFLSTTLPNYTVSDSTAVPVDEQYRGAFLYYVVGWAQLRDEEDTQDQRAVSFLNRFTSLLVGGS